MKKKTIYLIQELACLNPHSGAFQHISMGVKYLSKSFDLELYLTTEKIMLKDYTQIKKSDYVHKHKTDTKGVIYGTLKDIYILLSNVFKILKLYKLFKSKKIDFVYERASYLDFSGLIAARLAGVKHFYEANGLQYITRKKYYDSVFTLISKRLEKIAYSHSDFNFFIGTYSDFWNINKPNWINIENGIEKELLNDLPHKSPNKKLQVCFIGRPMKHQGLQLVNELYKSENIKNNSSIHFLGEGFENIENDLKKIDAEVINHGFKNRYEMKKLIESFDIGLILDSPDYQSCMKLFDYAVGNLAVLAISNYNLNYWFKDELIFHDGTVANLKQQFEKIIQNPEILAKKAQMLRAKVRKQHTWDLVFGKESNIINQHLNKD